MYEINSQLLLDGRHKQHSHILQQYKSKAEHYLCSNLNKNTNDTNVDRTPSGLLYIRQWNNMQYVSTAAFLATVYSDYITPNILICPGGAVGRDQLLEFAKAQADYILGSNPLGMSYLVGFGPEYPKNVHHRGASIVSYKEHKGFIGCTQGYDYWYGRGEPNPNVLVGALVGGPDCQDNFDDQRGNYMQTEACTYNTAPLVGVFARLNQLVGHPNHPRSDQPLVSSY